ncbi:MAG: hypothetical protein A2163_05545 [Actinobacteria bacterium RBG_13_35_12]|nr:MAG: hypothetical protein A2163_05545 [Actinobacteria bacterium RBG_13_35_12]
MPSSIFFISHKSILTISFFTINKISKLWIISILTFLKASFKTLLILFLKTAPPIFLLIPKPILTRPLHSAFLSIYIIKYLSFLHVPSFIILEKSLLLLSISNFILIFPFTL